MKSSILIVAASAVLATAGPLNRRETVIEWVDEVITVTVTADSAPTPTVFVENKQPAKPTQPAPQPIATPAAAANKAADQPAQKPVVQAPPAPSKIIELPKPQVSVVVNQPANNNAPPPSNAANSYQRAALDQHNIHRANSSSPGLSWDNGLAAQAQAWAQGCKFEHNRAGQNLASFGATGNLGSEDDAVARATTNQWYNSEFSSFQYYGQANPTQDFMAWGHYSQLVWKNTKRLGCATVQCPAGSVLSFPSMYTVCNYDPPGNFAGQYAENVLPPKGGPVAFA